MILHKKKKGIIISRASSSNVRGRQAEGPPSTIPDCPLLSEWAVMFVEASLSPAHTTIRNDARCLSGYRLALANFRILTILVLRDRLLRRGLPDTLPRTGLASPATAASFPGGCMPGEGP